MKSCFAYFLIALLLLQNFSREMLVINFSLNRATITARFCVNKARPTMHCNGRCYFAKQLKKQQEQEDQLPNPLKERLVMLPLLAQSLVPARPLIYPGSRLRYHRLPMPAAPNLGVPGIFHPPQG